MPSWRPLERLRSVFSGRLDLELGCQRRRAPSDRRCPNTYMERAARAAVHEGFYSHECAEGSLDVVP
jgi:hypothetical protein